MPAKKLYPIINGTKQCSKCHEYKDISEYPKARKGLSSICKVCKSEWAKQYRQRPDIKERSSSYSKEYMKKEENRERANKLNRERNKKEEVKIKRNEDRRNWTLKQKLAAIEYKGGKCILCGYNKDTAALEFHHINPEEKENVGGPAVISWRTFENNKEELDKCVLLCCRCHREVHSGSATLETT